MTLVETALLGTSRGKLEVPSTGMPIDALVEGLAVDRPERRILLLAGAAAIYERAGRSVARTVHPPQPAASDGRAACTAGAAALLVEILSSEHRDLLPEAFRTIAEAGRRLPAAVLPAVLDLRDSRFAALAAPILGERGRWLARFKDEWSRTLAAAVADEMPRELTPEIERDWNEAAFDKRRAALATARRLDPERGRAWLAEVWARENAEHRAGFISALESSLNAADEPFLDQALVDRSHSVRSSAARLLARLPDSKYAGRAVERADPLLSYRPPPAAGLMARVRSKIGGDSPAGTLAVTLPESFEKSWERDGLARKPPKGLGERAHWLSEALAFVPPAHWEDRFAVSGEAILAMAWNGEWGFAITLGLSRAAHLHGAVHWLRLLWNCWNRARFEPTPDLTALKSEMRSALLTRMSAEDATACAELLLEAGGEAAAVEAAAALERVPAPWTESLAATVCRALDGASGAADGPAAGILTAWIDVVRIAGRSVPRSAFSALERIRPVKNPSQYSHHQWNKALDGVAERLALRRRIHEEIRP